MHFYQKYQRKVVNLKFKQIQQIKHFWDINTKAKKWQCVNHTNLLHNSIIFCITKAITIVLQILMPNNSTRYISFAFYLFNWDTVALIFTLSLYGVIF